MIKYIETDLFAHVKHIESNVVIPHVCNNLGLWGSGFVVPLGTHFPQARQAYLDESRELGSVQIVKIENRTICNMIGQNGVKRKQADRPLRYNALSQCMDRVAKLCQHQKNSSEIVAPFFGADLAGGDWNFIERLIEDCWLECDIPVTICYLPGRLPKNWSLPSGS